MSYPKDPTAALSFYTCPYLSVFCPETQILGSTTPEFKIVEEKFKENYDKLLERHSQLAIYHKGEIVVDLTGKNCWFNCSTDNYNKKSIQNVFSTTKVVTSIVIAMLVDKDILDYNEKISYYWPEFSKNGKENITLRELMQHAAGLAFFDDRDPSTNDLVPLFNIDNENYLDDIAEIVERSYPHFQCNETKTEYHGLTRGLILNELVRRVDPKKRTIGRFIQEELVKQLKIDYHIGIQNNLEGFEISELSIVHHQSDSIGWRLFIVFDYLFKFFFGNCLGLVEGIKIGPHNFVRFILDDVLTGNLLTSPLVRSVLTIDGLWPHSVTDTHNLDHARIVESPSSNGQSNALSMAKLMNSFLPNHLDQYNFISKDTFNKLIENSGKPEYDRSIHCEVIYTTGGWAHFHHTFGAFNDFFGWSGIGGATMLMDIKNDLVIAYTTTRIETISPWEDIRVLAILEAVRKVVNIQ